MPNRLARATSLYLRQHADNPVDWFEWADEAFSRAKAEDKPLFISVGYSSCHWCHVMAHESFESDPVANALNASFVSVKVDREERPDVDDVLMAAVQMANGHGGWPMTVFMTPDLEPFFTGTYFPSVSREGMPSFLSVVTNLAQAWKEQRSEVVTAAREFAEAIRRAGGRAMSGSKTRFGVELLDDAVTALWANFDRDFGGFGGAPKFPPHTAVTFLLDYAALRHNLGEADALVTKASTMALATLLAMSRGGLYDHVGGGFHRYSTDAHWLLPHFEKMLSDNVLAVSNLSKAVAIMDPGEPRDELSRALDGTLTWLDSEMASPHGPYYSSVDADSEEGEGAFYVWTHDEIRETLTDRAEEFCQVFSVQVDGNFIDEASQHPTGKNVLYRSETTPMAQELARLRSVRESRPRPTTDTKCLLSWNGLAISALVASGMIASAARNATTWCEAKADGLPHHMAVDIAEGQAFLEDYAYFIDALLDLYEETHDTNWLGIAETLTDEAMAKFADNQGGFWTSSLQHQTPIARMKSVLDTAVPSGNSIMLRVLRRLGRTTEYEFHFHQTVGWAERAPTACESLLREHLYHLLSQPDGQVPQIDVAKPGEALLYLTDYEVGADAKGNGETTLVIDLPDGYHINSHEPPAKWLVPTTVSVEGVLGEAGFPDEPSGIYSGRIGLPLKLFASAGTHEFVLSVTYQMCDDTRCLAPETKTLTGLLIVPAPNPPVN